MSVNILDVAPNPRIVATHKYGDLEVTGLSIGGIVHLIKSHPELFKMFNTDGEQVMDLENMMDLGEEIVASFLAAGLGHPGNKEVIETCKAMNPEDSWEVAQAIIEESFPGGATNFFKRVTEAAKKANVIQVSKDLKESLKEKEETHLTPVS